jgi:hypothetical protein
MLGKQIGIFASATPDFEHLMMRSDWLNCLQNMINSPLISDTYGCRWFESLVVASVIND